MAIRSMIIYRFLVKATESFIPQEDKRSATRSCIMLWIFAKIHAGNHQTTALTYLVLGYTSSTALHVSSAFSTFLSKPSNSSNWAALRRWGVDICDFCVYWSIRMKKFNCFLDLLQIFSACQFPDLLVRSKISYWNTQWTQLHSKRIPKKCFQCFLTRTLYMILLSFHHNGLLPYTLFLSIFMLQMHKYYIITLTFRSMYKVSCKIWAS